MDKSWDDFMDRVLFPALFERLDGAFPEFGFKRKGRSWIGKRPGRSDDKLGRVECYENSKFGFVIHGPEFVPFMAYVNGGQYPKGPEYHAALSNLAERAGVTVPARTLSPEQAAQQERAQVRRSLLDTLLVICGEHLAGPAGKAARTYLTVTRGYADAHIQEFRMGLYPSHNALREALCKAGFDDATLKDARVLREDFEGRVIIPWNDASGQPINLYADLPQRPLPDHVVKFQSLAGEGLKSVPFHFDRARRAGKQDNAGRLELVLVEGIHDATLLQALGDTRVVACGGGQISSGQVATLVDARVRSVTIVLDDDAAGKRGTLATIKSLLAHGITPFVARLPDGLDPDTYVLKHGMDKWRLFVAGAENAFRYVARTMTAEHRGEAWTDKSRDACLHDAVCFAESLSDDFAPSIVDTFLPEIIKATGANEAALRLQVTAAREHKAAEEARKATDAEKREYEKLLQTAREKFQNGDVAGGKALLREEVGRLHAVERHRRIVPIRSVADEMDELVAYIDGFRGREFLGIPQHTLPKLDKMTWGLRGLMLLAAAPNTGKTTIAGQWGLDAVLHNDDVAFVFVSLEMPRKTVNTRFIAALARMKFKTLMRGSGRDGSFTVNELDRITEAQATLRSLKDRLYVFDTETFADPTLEKLYDHIDTVRARSGAKRLFVVVDYLNVWPVTAEAAKLHRTDGDVEKWRIGQMKELRDYIGGTDSAVVVISEAKKPQGSGRDKDKTWALDMSDVMGSARNTYTPDIILLLQNEFADDSPDAKEHAQSKKAAQKLVIVKGRDGVDRGTIDLWHYYAESRIEERK